MSSVEMKAQGGSGKHSPQQGTGFEDGVGEMPNPVNAAFYRNPDPQYFTLKPSKFRQGRPADDIHLCL